MNVDLCFVPATHEVADKLPAVSGSSGRLIVEQPPSETTEREWPGCVFEDPELTYEEAMLGFVAASQERAHQPESESKAEQAGKGSLKAEKRALRHEETQLRDERRQIREKRKLEEMPPGEERELPEKQRSRLTRPSPRRNGVSSEKPSKRVMSSGGHGVPNAASLLKSASEKMRSGARNVAASGNAGLSCLSSPPG